ALGSVADKRGRRLGREHRRLVDRLAATGEALEIDLAASGIDRRDYGAAGMGEKRFGGERLQRRDADGRYLERQRETAGRRHTDPYAGERTRPDGDRDGIEFAIGRPGLLERGLYHAHQMLCVSLAEVEHRASALAA